MVICGGTGGGGIDEVRSGRAVAAAPAAIPAPMPGRATPPKGVLVGSLSTGAGDETVCDGT